MVLRLEVRGMATGGADLLETGAHACEDIFFLQSTVGAILQKKRSIWRHLQLKRAVDASNVGGREYNETPDQFQTSAGS